MNSVIEQNLVHPAYNGEAVAGSNELATSVDQYWIERRGRYEATLSTLNTNAGDVGTEARWNHFCRTHLVDFLIGYTKFAAARVHAALRVKWENDQSSARKAQLAFQEAVVAEAWLPISQTPLTFECVSSTQRHPIQKYLPGIDRSERFAIGKIHIVVRWGDTYLFVIPPTGEHFSISTFVFTDRGLELNTGDVLPTVFSEALKSFRSEIQATEEAFSASLEFREAQSRSGKLVRLLGLLPRYETLWQSVQIPDADKLDILRRLELFESGDPAAPFGLLLHGPSGTGKSLIARTIAETSNCDFQKLSLPDLKRVELGASGKRVREIWDHARAHRPAVIFVDECDSVFGDRGLAATDAVSAEVVQAFLPEWDGIQNTTGIMVIGATNRRHTIDPAIISRFGWELEIGLQSGSLRKSILEQELQQIGVAAHLPEDIEVFTQGMSGRDLRTLASSARSLAFPATPTVDHIYLAASSMRKRGSVQIGSAHSWKDLTIDVASLERLELIGELLKDSDDWASHGVTIPGSLLLTGTDAKLKHQVAQVLANESRLTLIAPTLSELKNPTLGESGNRIKLLFERAHSAVIFIDRLDTVTPNRGLTGAMDPLTNEIIGQLVQECERVQGRDRRIFLLGGTNAPSQVDPAVLECFQEQLEITLSDHTARLNLFRQLLAAKRLSFSEDEGVALFQQLSAKRVMDSREIEALVRAAEQRALIRAVRNGGPDQYSIELADFGIQER